MCMNFFLDFIFLFLTYKLLDGHMVLSALSPWRLHRLHTGMGEEKNVREFFVEENFIDFNFNLFNNYYRMSKWGICMMESKSKKITEWNTEPEYIYLHHSNIVSNTNYR